MSNNIKIKSKHQKPELFSTKHNDIRRKVSNKEHRGLWGLFKFIVGYDKKKKHSNHEYEKS